MLLNILVVNIGLKWRSTNECLNHMTMQLSFSFSVGKA